ncbi:MAG: hypothetical protein E2576_06935 [Alcaligenaceae bacterium]|nr:hypothetical protein [Alcaligenaceae bacterium SAGV5]MPS53345.1 hypothetical protein [Alcaligenaceae bacterium SAGV3]MPT56447.1 hypothetical protein [Alcaligenaceae bacterium]
MPAMLRAQAVLDSTAQANALELSRKREGYIAPTQLFGLSADLFSRTYFAEVLPETKWGPDHSLWAPNLAAFKSDMVRLLLPPGVALDDYLADALVRGLSEDEVKALRREMESDDVHGAVRELTRIGLSWQVLVRAHTMQTESRYYSLAEQEQTRREMRLVREHLIDTDSGTFKEKVKPLAEFAGSDLFNKYVAVVNQAFMDGAKRVGNAEREKSANSISVLLERWRVRLRRGS